MSIAIRHALDVEPHRPIIYFTYCHFGVFRTSYLAFIFTLYFYPFMVSGGVALANNLWAFFGVVSVCIVAFIGEKINMLIRGILAYV